VIHDLERGGIPRAILAEAIATGALSLDFVDHPSYSRFTALEPETFAQVAVRTGIAPELLATVREATGSPTPGPDDHIRPNELRALPMLRAILDAGVGAEHIERTVRVAGDGMRRIAETESDWWWTEILQPLFAAGLPPEEIGRRTTALAGAMDETEEAFLIALYHGQQVHAWMRNIFEGFEGTLVARGLYTRLERQPAIAFVDITGYSSLTEQRGDATAAELAGRVARVVQREAAAHGGRAIKWLGDGVMLFFREADRAVDAALDIMAALEADGLPQAHAGIHTGPVLFQEGDYFGRTVNAAARIADRATRGQVVVSDAVTRSMAESDVRFQPLGEVALKNLAEPMVLFSASR
jgi:class 3 adenylate cyclase